MNVVVKAANKLGIFIDVVGDGSITSTYPSGVSTSTSYPGFLDDSIACTLASHNKMNRNRAITA